MTKVDYPRPYMPKAKSDNWNTPTWLYRFLRQLFNLQWDVTPEHFPFSSLAIPWRGRVYLNPPFSKLAEFVEKAYHEKDNCQIIVALLPVYTDQMWFHRYVWKKARIIYIPRRLTFGKARKPAPFRSMVVIWSSR